jgi:hypothetical protein
MSKPPRRSFVKRSKGQQRCPRTITLDGYAASHRAVHELQADGSLSADTKLRSSKYLNNPIEQDHRGVKQRIAVMLGFKRFKNGQSRSPASSYCIASGRDSSDWVVWTFKASPRLRSGTPCLGPEVSKVQKGTVSACDGYLHQSPWNQVGSSTNGKAAGNLANVG